MTIRTRFAPSPTGFLHVGNVRSALFPYLVAKQAGGTFVLRIEDTDQAREVEGAIDYMHETLQWLGIEWDEGPDKPGEYRPYIQSQRRDIYLKWAQRLINSGRAYADIRTPDELNALREDAKSKKQPFLARDYRPENPPTWELGMPLRFLSEPKVYTWQDAVMGELSAGQDAVDDFVMLKSDGLPTYNFAHVVDDTEMAITHVIRGLEYISSQPKYLNLYEALELTPPILAHVPHIMNEQGNKKLSKRDGAKSILNYRDEGYLPEAMLNFLASMGWNDGTEQEIFTHEELIEKFSLERVQRSGARFDEKRLLWLNGQFIRELSLDDLYVRVSNYWPEGATNADESYKKQVLALAQDRLKTLADLPQLTRYFFEEPTINMTLITDNRQLKKLENSEIVLLLKVAREALTASDWTSEAIQGTLNQLLETTGQKPGILFSLVRIATTWVPFSPQLNDTLALLGKDATLARLGMTISSLE
ncbi:MAG: glutamate--tRNA ligase [Candidatus Saccharimonadales bacterium]